MGQPFDVVGVKENAYIADEDDNATSDNDIVEILRKATGTTGTLRRVEAVIKEHPMNWESVDKEEANR